MKNLTLFLVLLSLAAKGIAQTNTFPASGNVGIGTTSPATQLDVVGEVRVNQGAGALILWQPSSTGYSGLRIYNDQTASGMPSLEMDYSGSAYSGSLLGGGSTGQAAAIATTGNYPLDFGTNNITRMTIAGSGNVGIGTTSPTQKLSVNGTVLAKEVIVQTGWSDFVFDESYKLKALSETEAFIKAEKHLPGIPSAKEVVEQGVSVGEMQAKLLAKIEELTLHVIEQEKRITAQASEMAELKAQNTRMELQLQSSTPR